MTDKQKSLIIEKVLEAEGIPWQRPFCYIGKPKNWNSKREYKGINLLLFSALDYPSPFFITPKKAFSENITLEKKSGVFAVAWIPKFKKLETESVADFNKRKKEGNANYFSPFFHSVWNVSKTSLWDSLKDEEIESQVIIDPQKIIDQTSLEFKIEDSGSAWCIPQNNPPKIGMPLKEKFNSLEEYYSALFHEMVHATKNILSRDRADKNKSEAYASEELVAEIGAWLLCQESGISVTVDNSASYISGWKSRIKDDPDILFWAMKEAQKAVDVILKRKEQ